MEKSKIDRINELARLAKERELTQSELDAVAAESVRLWGEGMKLKLQD